MLEREKKPVTVKCAYCDQYREEEQTFTCRTCRKSPLCNEHVDREYRICSGCATEKRMRIYHDLVKQESSLRGFLRLTQFIFIISSILFTSSRLFGAHVPDAVRETPVFEYLYVWGGLAVLGMAISSILLSSQRGRLRDIDKKIRSRQIYQRSYQH